MLSPRRFLFSSVLLCSLFTGLAQGEDSLGPGGRLVFGPTDECRLDAGMDIEVVWTAFVAEPTDRDLDFSTDIHVKVGKYSETHTVRVIANAGAGDCRGGRFGGSCGTGSVDGEKVELICLSENGDYCQFPWIKTRFPIVPPDMFDENDVIEVLLTPTPGSEDEVDTGDDYAVEPVGGSKFYDRSFESVELVPVIGTRDTFDVVVEYRLAYNTRMPPLDWRTDIVLNQNGKSRVFEPWCGPWLINPQSDCGSCSNQTCAEIKCDGELVATLRCESYENDWGAFGCACVSDPIKYTIPSVQLKAGEEIELLLTHAPGAMPELRELDRDSFVVCGVEAQSTTYGRGKPGTFGVPTLDSIAPPILGQESGIVMKQALPDAKALLFLGFERLDLPFDEGRLLVLPAFVLFVPTSVDNDGTLALKALLPDDPTLCGASLYYQLMFRDPGAAGDLQLAMTNGLNQVFGWY